MPQAFALRVTPYSQRVVWLQGLVYKMTKGPWGETGRAGRGRMLVLGILELDAGSGERTATIAPPTHEPLCLLFLCLERHSHSKRLRKSSHFPKAIQPQFPTQLYTMPPQPTNNTTILNQITTLQKETSRLTSGFLPFVEIILEGIFLHWVGHWKMSAKIISNSRCSTLSGKIRLGSCSSLPLLFPLLFSL